MKQIILGTAGHIDHGKTTLVKALTGMDTDRLKEEKLRGITIELGFADIDLPSGHHVGIVDMPGHEKFVKNMVAGAAGIDMVAMVIAADEGVMPQTQEHMEICTLLDVKHGVIVLSKTDLVDEEWMELVLEDIKQFIKGTFLENADVIPVSSVTGSGISDFIESLEGLINIIPQRPSTDLFRLPVDRVFTMKGFGTVITGTLISGHVNVGDGVMIYPSRIVSKVRGIQFHNQTVDSAKGGMRTAINFQGLNREDVQRGDVIANTDVLIPSYMVDVSMHFLKSNKKPIKNRTRLRFHSGTSEILGYLILLDGEELLPGENTVAQIRLESPLCAIKDDPFVLRSYSPVRTVGGGKVLNPIPPKHKRYKKDIVEGLKSLVNGTPKEIVLFHIEAAAFKGISFIELKVIVNVANKELKVILDEELSTKNIIQVDKEKKICIHKKTASKLEKMLKSYLEDYHKTNPLKNGMQKEELKSKVPSIISQKIINLLLNKMIKEEKIFQEEKIVRLAEHAVSLAGDQKVLRKKILDLYGKHKLTPPYFKDLCDILEIDSKSAKDVVIHLLEEDLIAKVKEGLYYDVQEIGLLEDRLVNFLENNKEITMPQFKEMTGASRKYVIPLAEYFDSKNITLRIGDIRKLRRG